MKQCRHWWREKFEDQQTCCRCGIRRRRAWRQGGGPVRRAYRCWEYSRDGIDWMWVRKYQRVPVCDMEAGS